MRDYYIKQGPKAWEDKVPFIVTNTAVAAHFHANTIINQIKHSNKNKFVIIDYGAGTGQHGWLIAKAVCTLSKEHNIPITQFKIILTDISQHTLDYLAAHPQIKVFVEQNLIEITQISGDWEKDLSLLTQDSSAQYSLIANYHS